MTTQTPAEALAMPVDVALADLLKFEFHFRTTGNPIVAKQIRDIHATLARAVEDAEWRPIETAPKDEKVFFWIVPKTLDDGIDVTIFCDTSGKPILSSHKPYWLFCEFNCWGGLSRATHWRPNLTGPAIDTARGVGRGSDA